MSSNTLRGEAVFHIHYSLVRKGRKETRGDRKGTGDSFCICVQYGFFWFFILHSQELPMGSHLLPRLCHTCLPVWKWLSCRRWMRLTDHIYLSGVYWAHRAPRIKPWTRAQKQVCIEAANLLHRPCLIVRTPEVITRPHSCFPHAVVSLCVSVCVCARLLLCVCQSTSKRQCKVTPQCCFTSSFWAVIRGVKDLSKALGICICILHIAIEIYGVSYGNRDSNGDRDTLLLVQNTAKLKSKCRLNYHVLIGR